MRQPQPSTSLTVSMDMRLVMRKSRCANYGSRRVLKTAKIPFEVDLVRTIETQAFHAVGMELSSLLKLYFPFVR
jgi:hypothetical protein